jgi:hypothetical protein
MANGLASIAKVAVYHRDVRRRRWLAGQLVLSGGPVCRLHPRLSVDWVKP